MAQQLSFPNVNIPSAGLGRLRLEKRETMKFRHVPPQMILEANSSEVLVERWLDKRTEPRVLKSTESSKHFAIAIALKVNRFTFVSDGKLCFKGAARPGSLQITSPNQNVRFDPEGTTDVMHSHMSVELLQNFYASLDLKGDPSAISLVCPNYTEDRFLGRLARALLLAVPLRNAGNRAYLYNQLYIDTLGLALVAHLVGHYSNRISEEPSKNSPELAIRPFRRAMEFIEENLNVNFTLADLAKIAGLSPSYFAAAFRNASGVAPHAYVLERRVARAKELLRNTEIPLVEIALLLGFANQSHFSTVFRRFHGSSPSHYRRI